MRSNELRQGNLIYWNIPEKQGVIHTVVGIRNNKPQTIPISLGESIEDYNPIPLTEEWLLKFGFFSKYKSNHTKWNKGWVEIDQASDEDDEGNSIPQKQEFYYAYKTEIKFVHQLQNLIFATTGEELFYDITPQ